MEHHLTAEGIDPELLTDRDALLPLHWACAFVNKIGRIEGIENLGFRVGAQTPIASIEAFGSILAESITLKDLIDRLLRWVPHFDSSAQIWTESGVTPRTIKLRLRHDADVGRPTADAFGMMILINAVRMALGPSWRPKRFWIDHTSGDSRSFEALSSGTAIRNVDHIAFEIPLGRMGAALPRTGATLVSESDLERTAPESDLIGSLTQAMRSAMG